MMENIIDCNIIEINTLWESKFSKKRWKVINLIFKDKPRVVLHKQPFRGFKSEIKTIRVEFFLKNYSCIDKESK